MCTEKLTRRGALVGGAAVAVSAALAGTAQAGEREPAAFSGRRHGLRDLTHELKTSIPAFAPGEEPVRETVDDLRAFERRHGRIPRDSAVRMYSGWGAKVDDADAYRGDTGDGVPHFSGFGAEATGWLLRRRGIRSLGVDTLSIDPYEDGSGGQARIFASW
jgi:kynurenine formamidase